MRRAADGADARKARLAADPADAGAWTELGTDLLALGAADRAASCADRALRLRPRDRAGLLLLGRAERALGRPGLAWLPLEAAAEAAPRDAEARTELGATLLALGRLDDAAAALEAALALPGCPDEAHALLGSTLYRMHLAGEPEHARAHAQRWAEHFPEHPLPGHALAALGGAPPPAEPGASWVRMTFDRLADGFDLHLEGLRYTVPEDLTALLRRHLPGTGHAVLDIGCGTGLCGPFLRPFSRQLEGVDLSPGMLAEAARKGIYDALHAAEAKDFLAAAPAAWDAAIAADVLIYVGDAGPLLRSLAGALRPGGVFACSIEEAVPGGAGWTLHASGRYRHRPDHMLHLMAEAGLKVLEVEPTSIRMERGAPIPGCLIAARRG